jgi:hypothetical protein
VGAAVLLLCAAAFVLLWVHLPPPTGGDASLPTYCDAVRTTATTAAAAANGSGSSSGTAVTAVAAAPPRCPLGAGFVPPPAVYGFGDPAHCPAPAGQGPTDPDPDPDTPAAPSAHSLGCCTEGGARALAAMAKAPPLQGGRDPACARMLLELGAAPCGAFAGAYTDPYDIDVDSGSRAAAEDSAQRPPPAAVPLHVCSSFCRALYSRCRDAKVSADGRAVAEAFPAFSEGFCGPAGPLRLDAHPRSGVFAQDCFSAAGRLGAGGMGGAVWVWAVAVAAAAGVALGTWV